MSAILWDVHAIYGPRLRALQFSDGRTIVHVPVDNLQQEVKTQKPWNAVADTVYVTHLCSSPPLFMEESVSKREDTQTYVKCACTVHWYCAVSFLKWSSIIINTHNNICDLCFCSSSDVLYRWCRWQHLHVVELLFYYIRQWLLVFLVDEVMFWCFIYIAFSHVRQLPFLALWLSAGSDRDRLQNETDCYLEENYGFLWLWTLLETLGTI